MLAFDKPSTAAAAHQAGPRPGHPSRVPWLGFTGGLAADWQASTSRNLAAVALRANGWRKTEVLSCVRAGRTRRNFLCWPFPVVAAGSGSADPPPPQPRAPILIVAQPSPPCAHPPPATRTARLAISPSHLRRRAAVRTRACLRVGLGPASDGLPCASP